MLRFYESNTHLKNVRPFYLTCINLKRILKIKYFIIVFIEQSFTMCKVINKLTKLNTDYG